MCDREMTLEEYCAKLPGSHLVNVQLKTLIVKSNKTEDVHAMLQLIWDKLIKIEKIVTFIHDRH